ncbi:hypothetical protein LAD77_00685 [Klebsiella pneumoniae]|nr:hypothetical protein [Klebsiella pneumoniae]
MQADVLVCPVRVYPARAKEQLLATFTRKVAAIPANDQLFALVNTSDSYYGQLLKPRPASWQVCW